VAETPVHDPANNSVIMQRERSAILEVKEGSVNR
jgi:hypothetical protein